MSFEGSGVAIPPIISPADNLRCVDVEIINVGDV